MRASSHKLATALASRLNRILPSPWRVSARAGSIDVYLGDTPEFTALSLGTIEDDNDPEWSLLERAEAAVHGVLNSVQDSVSEYLREPWPSTHGHTMAMPEVRADAEFVRLWFGDDEKAPVVGIPPIPFAEITATNDQR